jgi:hypothetical protein
VKHILSQQPNPIRALLPSAKEFFCKCDTKYEASFTMSAGVRRKVDGFIEIWVCHKQALPISLKHSLIQLKKMWSDLIKPN